MKVSHCLAVLILFLLTGLTLTRADPGFRRTYHEKKADHLFALKSYERAVSFYQRALKKQGENPRLPLKIAESYFALNQSAVATVWYAKVYEANLTPAHWWHYIQALIKTEQLDAARHQISRYLQHSPDHEAAQNMLTGLNQRSEFFRDSSRFVVVPININDKEADFSPTFYGDRLVFASARQRAGTKRNRQDRASFLRLYEASPLDSFGANFNGPRLLLKQSTVQLHEGPISFYNEGKEAVITTNNPTFKKDRGETITFNRLQLQRMRRAASGKWSDPEPLTFNSKNYSVGPPTVSANGKSLYFASDMPGGEGGVDLYVAYAQEDGWGEPINLGPLVNTDGDEMFPFIDSTETLYFASNGHPGLGGLDLFSFSISHQPAVAPQNLGFPINGAEDDFGLTTRGDSAGYFSSRRQGEDDVYYFYNKLPPTSENKVELIVRVVDGITNEPITNAPVNIQEQTGKSSINRTTDTRGEMTITADREAMYLISGELEGESWSHQPVVTDSLLAAGENVVEIMLFHQVDAIKAMDVVIFDRYADRGDILVELNHQLYAWQEKGGKNYLVSDNKEIMLFKSDGITGNVGLDRKIDEALILEGVAVRSITVIHNIYFDFDQYDVRADAEAALDKLANVMNEHKSLTINIGAHTDSRGSDPYNQRLSHRRAQATVDYLVAKGIEEERLTSYSFGEERLFNRCVDGAKCAASQHQANRRVEFGIVSANFTSPAITENFIRQNGN